MQALRMRKLRKSDMCAGREEIKNNIESKLNIKSKSSVKK